MRIPLDYYQILGIPTVATMGQIQQAYADRNLQQPRHEYNSTAIESRRKLLSDAYEILAHPAERSQYDAALMETHPHFNVGENPLTNLDLEPDRVLGGLLIMAETGEYEKLLSIAWPLLADDESVKQAMGSGGLEETWHALYLTVALTLLELGRERWRQNRPAEGCEALETSIKLLRQQNIYPTVQAEIQRELYKFRPQYILSVLSANEQSALAPNLKGEAERQQALVLLQELLFTATNPHGYSVYGMTQDGFIAYLDQIRRHLTTHEQQALFEEPATQSGNPIFTYLLVYAMVARGFYYQMPELIYRAQQLLSRHLSRRQDVFVEQALCFLLLGQTTEAQMALSRSSDRESLAYIHKNSSSSDLLPGLCRYSELWFQTQVFPHFSDLVHHRVSLNTYFENPQVQAYLNDLPTPTSGALNAEIPLVLPELEAFNQVPNSAPLPNYRGSVPLISSLGISEPLTQIQLPGELPQAERTSAPEAVPSASTSPDNVVPFERPKKKRETMPPEEVAFIKNPSHNQLEQLDETVGGQLAAIKSKAIVPRKNSSLARRRRYKYQFQILIGFAGLMSAVALIIWMAQINKTTKQVANSNANPSSTNKVVPPVAPANSNVATAMPKTTAVSPSKSASPVAKAALTVETAQLLVEKWLSAKNKALSANYDVSTLGEVLADPALSRAKNRSKEAKNNGSHIDYQHQVKVQSVEPPSAQGNQSIEATIDESAQYYDHNQLVKSMSYQKNLRLKYQLIQQGGRWLIKDMTVIQ
jgi:ARC6-like, IMS domain/DnaJ domain